MPVVARPAGNLARPVSGRVQMKSTRKKSPTEKKRSVFFRASKTLKDGRKIYAKDYGYKAFPMGVK
jgi:hypothetical protein